MHWVVDVLQVYLFVLIARIILSWFPMPPDSAFSPVVRVLSAVTDPVLNVLRKVLPPLNVGGMGIDLSPLLLIIAIQILLRVLG
ncbi:MAG TPA: YggT family protein [Acidimicrobiales bacterium]|nr:YggT family protein [Acidimicrobiales bacterium]